MVLLRMVQYLTGVHNDAVAAVAHACNIGLLVQPGNRYDKHAHRYPSWAGDNGAFTRKPGGFNARKFREMLRRSELLAARSTCQFIVAPDCLLVQADGTVIGDALRTLIQFRGWSGEIRALGYPVALVAQDGLERYLAFVPWELVDVLFIGGSDGWKLGEDAQKCVEAARQRGKRVHMGRVNSAKRMMRAQDMQVDSVDGTYLKFGPDVNLPNLIVFLEKCARRTLDSLEVK
jgi:hypothetical protein